MNLVICAADAGHTAAPKCLLPFGERTVLEELLGEALDGGAFARVVIVGAARDRQHEPRLRDILRRSRVPVADAVFVADSHHPADAALVAARHLAAVYGAAAEPLVVHTLDAVQYGRDFRDIGRTLAAWDGYVDVFPGEHPRNGDARVDEHRRVVELTPLQLLSGVAVTGLYGFRSASAFADWAAGAGSMRDVCRRVLMSGGRLTANADFRGTQTVLLPPGALRAAA